MLHVTTEIGKVGRQEREKRHYDDMWEMGADKQVYRPSGRVYIPHGKGHPASKRPHPQHVEPEYSECGPDWKSRLRWLPHPSQPNAKHPHRFHQILRTYPGIHNARTGTEWTAYPNHTLPFGYHTGKRCYVEGSHQRSRQSFDEITDTMRLGTRFKVGDPRGGIPAASPGDKSYQVPEYSPQFHQVGSTRPVVVFGGSAKVKPDTFIPLIPLPAVPVKSYRLKERQRRHTAEVKTVETLEMWRPATPLEVSPVSS
ncbi:spermatogenesis-associated serine-rich protein 1-like [Branchiostoma lanceolatum]|uniref:spermatogenesis-associated serine-rich protein 1-like n=1 Tax=Branchiostoma lanceolatum TaxID=7740 RepID=UPI00345712FE